MPEGTYALAGAAGEDANASGDLDVRAGSHTLAPYSSAVPLRSVRPLDHSEHFEVRDFAFTGNSAITGGGIASTSDDLDIVNSTVTGNSGGGRYFAGRFN